MWRGFITFAPFRRVTKTKLYSWKLKCFHCQWMLSRINWQKWIMACMFPHKLTKMNYRMFGSTRWQKCIIACLFPWCWCECTIIDSTRYNFCPTGFLTDFIFYTPLIDRSHWLCACFHRDSSRRLSSADEDDDGPLTSWPFTFPSFDCAHITV